MDNQFLIRFIRENLPILMFVFLLALLAGGWVVFESARSLLKRDEVDKLRRRVEELERSQALLVQPAPPRKTIGGPMVLSTRWVGRGGAATSSDGGCLVLVEEVIPASSQVLLTVRIDGVPVRERQAVSAGESLELDGKFGFYTVEVGAVSGHQAQVSGWLRNRHAAS